MNLIWFRNDLRVADNPALYHAAQDSDSVVGVYLLCRKQWTAHGVGANQQALIVEQLKTLSKNLKALNIPLIVIDADTFSASEKTVVKLCEYLSVEQLHFNIQYPVNERQRDQNICQALEGKTECLRHVGDSLVGPWQLVNGDGVGYKVFSAFARKLKASLLEQPIHLYPKPERQRSENLTLVKDELFKKLKLKRVDLEMLKLASLSSAPLPRLSEKLSAKRLAEFCAEPIKVYPETRDIPSIAGTSELSCALALGVISASQCYQAAKAAAPNSGQKWLDELIWRDFYRAVMWHYPHVCRGQGFNPVDRQIRWSNDPDAIARWQRGETGIPMIDAAIQQLLTTGWMHNRLRMVVASYLTKNLWVDWRIGEAFFAKHLFDYDFASNNGGWQWCASVGTDAAPYFRIFNPQSQQKRFDSEARFIKKWLPQLGGYDAKKIHAFEKTSLGNYPQPQVDLKETRKAAIESFKIAKQQFD